MHFDFLTAVAQLVFNIWSNFVHTFVVNERWESSE